MWTDDRDLIMKLFDEKEEAYPRTCPCCGHKKGHIYYYKNDESDMYGGAWAWCSGCFEFSHSRSVIPEWWKNTDVISFEELHATPDNLNEASDAIDNWVNELLKQENVIS